MKDQRDRRLATSDLPEIVRKIRARTPARLLAGRAGAAYRTTTQLDLREAHATARDAVRAELNAERAFGKDFVNTWNLFEVSTNAVHKDEYLLRPELGRHFDGRSREELQRRCSSLNDLQIAIGDGLSVSAVAAQVPLLLPLIIAGAGQWHWKIGQTFVIHHCRVGILNEIGELLNPRVALLLIGERPGLATAESLSVYLAYLPNNAHTDADRNVISNIHLRGLSPHEAAARILSLAARMMETNSSGYQLKEAPPALGHP
jgi:ethanolamine ammonia-lyase small subunit